MQFQTSRRYKLRAFGSNRAELSIRFVARRTETSSFEFVKIFNENWDWARLSKLRQRNEFQRRNSFVLVSYLERISVVSFYSRYTLQSRVENFINYAALIKDFISLIQVEDKIFVFRFVINECNFEIYWMSVEVEFYMLSNKERRWYDFEFNNCGFIFAMFHR